MQIQQESNRVSSLSTFEKWLVERSYSEKIIKDFIKRATQFNQWLTTKKLTLETLDYQDILNYIAHLQSQKKSKTTINTTLRTIEHYYTFLELANVALNVRLRGTYQEQVLLLTEEEITTIYSNYENTTQHGYFKYSNKLILGLIIFQGLDKQDLMNVEITDVHLEKGILRCPGGMRRKNERIIELEAHQIIPLHDYIKSFRGIGRNGKVGTEESQKLFHPNVNKEQRIHDQLKALAKDIKAQNPDINFKRLTQLKQSRIGIWIDRYGLRKAQYLAGYKDVGNIEKYRNKDMKNLSKQIELFHPLQ